MLAVSSGSTVTPCVDAASEDLSFQWQVLDAETGEWSNFDGGGGPSSSSPPKPARAPSAVSSGLLALPS